MSAFCLPEAGRADESLAAVTVLKTHCWSCHAADRQEGGLRLDSRAAVLKGGDAFAPVVVSGKSGDSPLIEFISQDNADLKMPPDGPRLSAEDVRLLRRWIDTGLEWPASLTPPAERVHWSFTPCVRPAVPSPGPDDRSPIDAFLTQRLKAEGLEFSPPADRLTLIRRLSFDLCGLPPSPEEVTRFMNDTDPLAWERLVDRYLASPRFGERWARHWLDVVRFAESHGFEMNQVRPNAWHYRDYVISALNADLPYDQFIRQQLAGDLLGADAATGFLVGGPWDQVKSPDPVLTAQQRADELHDMVSTTGSAFLGLTVGCSRCHSHKFDPIPQADYYALKACFEGVQHGERAVRSAADAARQQTVDQLRSELTAIGQTLQAFEPLSQPLRRITISPDDPVRTARLETASGPAALAPGAERGAAADPGDADRLPNLSAGYLYWKSTQADVFTWNPAVTGNFRIWVSWGCGWDTHAPDAQYVLDGDGMLETTADQRLLGRADQRRFADGTGEMPGRPLWSGFKSLDVHSLTPETRIVLRSGAAPAYVTADLLVLEEVAEDGAAPASQPHIRAPVHRGQNVDRFAPVEARFVRLTIRATNQAEPCLDELEVFTAGADSRNVALASRGARVSASSSLPGYAIHKLPHIHDGRYGNDFSWISNEVGTGWVQIELPGVETIERVEWSRDRSESPQYADRLATDYVIEVSLDGNRWTTVASSMDRLPWRKSGLGVPHGALFAAGRAGQSAERLRELLNDRARIHSDLTRLQALPVAYAGRFVQPGPTLRLHRGDATQPREAIAPGSLSQLSSAWTLAADTPEAERRKALADWIASRQNPLTARVIVNRLWQHHFGTGLVETPSDFGRNGGTPSHPELLNWLACELVEPSNPADHAWSLKSIHRLICCSAAYRQSSASRPEGLARDAANRLLWRYSPRRLEAEALRDAILTVSGMLSEQGGGPGFDLFEPNTNYVKVYVPKSQFGPAEFRRMVYQSKPRMQLEDTFGAFDCPDAGQIAPRRSTSVTPLQALSLLNSPFLVQQSESLAARLRRDAGDDAVQQVQRGFELALQRVPDTAEREAATALVREHGLPAFCRALLNASEFLMVF